MTLKERLNADFKEAMKNKEEGPQGNYQLCSSCNQAV